MHALIIEDEVMIAAAIEYVLRQCGFDTFDVAPSSWSAIAAANVRRPDLITADVQLKPGCGIETVHEICGHPPIPVIYITGSAAEVHRRLSNQTILKKPFTEQTLTYAVAASLAC
jgi:DNA-binding response OmpR family regulator